MSAKVLSTESAKSMLKAFKQDRELADDLLDIVDEQKTVDSAKELDKNQP